MRERIEDLPVAVEAPGMTVRNVIWGETAIGHLELPAGFDFTPMFKGLPDDACQCPHWGYVIKGAVHLKYTDGSQEVAAAVYPRHPKNNTFPGEMFLELAADAIDEAGASREQPIESEGIRERYLPECTAHTKAQHQHSRYALRAAAMIRGGVDPGLLDEVIWWQSDDLWVWALDALAVDVRVAADRTGLPVADICERLARRYGVALKPPN